MISSSPSFSKTFVPLRLNLCNSRTVLGCCRISDFLQGLQGIAISRRYVSFSRRRLRLCKKSMFLPFLIFLLFCIILAFLFEFFSLSKIVYLLIFSNKLVCFGAAFFARPKETAAHIRAKNNKKGKPIKCDENHSSRFLARPM